MKKLNPIVKVLISTFCLMIFLANFIQVLNASEYDCNNGLTEECIIIANHDCDEDCELQDEDCDYIDFVSGACNYGACDQWWDYYCTSGFLDTNFIICGESGCPMK